MPYSSPEGKNELLAMVQSCVYPMVYHTVVDVGTGAGTYSTLWRNKFPDTRWIGIDGYYRYYRKFGLDLLYDMFFVIDVRHTFLLDGAFKYADFAVLGDILEHLADSEISSVCETLLRKCRYLAISCPANPYHQLPGEYRENELERHQHICLPIPKLSVLIGRKPLCSWTGQLIGVGLWKGDID